jgi:hypothetical protein
MCYFNLQISICSKLQKLVDENKLNFGTPLLLPALKNGPIIFTEFWCLHSIKKTTKPVLLLAPTIERSSTLM